MHLNDETHQSPVEKTGFFPLQKWEIFFKKRQVRQIITSIYLHINKTHIYVHMSAFIFNSCCIKLFMFSFTLEESGWCSAGLEAALTLVLEWKKPPCCTSSTRNLLCGSVSVCLRERFIVCVLGWLCSSVIHYMIWCRGKERERTGPDCDQQSRGKSWLAKERGNEKWKLRLTLFSFLLNKIQTD